MGLERIIMVMENQNCDFLQPRTCDLYIVPMDEQAVEKAMTITKKLREYGYWVEYDVVGRTLKAQMKYADKINASFTLVLGENELVSNKAKVKNMNTGEQLELDLDDKFADRFDAICVDNMLGNLDQLIAKDE
ncbi:MAG: His/Gly/Thr/Pro-type tRNA ligase C-terminal domain-containing protein [Ruminococcus sp.]